MKYRPQGTSTDNQIEEIFGKAYDHKVISRLIPFLKPQKNFGFLNADHLKALREPSC